MIPHNLRYLKQSLDIVRRVNSTADDILLKSDLTAQQYDKFLIDIQVYGAYEAIHLVTSLLPADTIEKLMLTLASASTTVARRPARKITTNQPAVDLYGLV